MRKTLHWASKTNFRNKRTPFELQYTVHSGDKFFIKLHLNFPTHQRRVIIIVSVVKCQPHDQIPKTQPYFWVKVVRLNSTQYSHLKRGVVKSEKWADVVYRCPLYRRATIKFLAILGVLLTETWY